MWEHKQSPYYVANSLDSILSKDSERFVFLVGTLETQLSLKRLRGYKGIRFLK